jgi:hypothetical protein
MADANQPDQASNEQQENGQGHCPQQSGPIQPAHKAGRRYGDGKGNGYQKGQYGAQPERINRDRPAPGLVHGLENHQNILHLNRPKADRGQNHPKAVDDSHTRQQGNHKTQGLPAPHHAPQLHRRYPQDNQADDDIKALPDLKTLDADQKLGIGRLGQLKIERPPANVFHELLHAGLNHYANYAAHQGEYAHQGHQFRRQPAA